MLHRRVCKGHFSWLWGGGHCTVWSLRAGAVLVCSSPRTQHPVQNPVPGKRKEPVYIYLTDSWLAGPWSLSSCGILIFAQMQMPTGSAYCTIFPCSLLWPHNKFVVASGMSAGVWKGGYLLLCSFLLFSSGNVNAMVEGWEALLDHLGGALCKGRVQRDRQLEPWCLGAATLAPGSLLQTSFLWERNKRLSSLNHCYFAVSFIRNWS